MVREFVRWWLAQLADLVPEQLRRFCQGDLNAVVVAPLGSLASGNREVAVMSRRNGKEINIGQFLIGTDEFAAALSRKSERQAVIRLPGSDVLTKTLTVPIASEAHLSQALRFELDRETPFDPDEVFWTYRVTQRDRRAGSISVRLLVLARTQLTSFLDALGEAGLRPQRAEIADGPDRGSYLPIEADGRRIASGRRLLGSAFACCIALGLVAVSVPFVRQAWSLAALQRTIAVDRVTAAEAERLRREIDGLAGSAELIDRERKDGGRPLAVLAALTSLLPPDTYLTDFLEQNSQVTITGRSAGASRLIALLTKAELLRNPSFSAPVTRIATNQEEVFTISAELAP